MSRFTATVTVWPYSTGAGGTADQTAVGDERQQIEVPADNIRAALEIAEIFAAGIRTNPRVWQANVTSLAKVPHS